MYEVYCFGVQIICKIQRSFVTGTIKVLVNDKVVHNKLIASNAKDPFYWEHETEIVKIVVGQNAKGDLYFEAYEVAKGVQQIDSLKDQINKEREVFVYAPL